MNDELRVILYPLGFLSAVAFGARFIVQWISSEREGRTVVPRLFWILSLVGNVFLLIHSFIQVQFHVCIIQAGNAVISWRNLNLMQEPQKQKSLSTVLWILAATLAMTTAIFMFQDSSEWFRIPVAPWQEVMSQQPLSMMWHVIGFAGFALFSSRFWVQWWNAEKMHKSVLSASFWWISLSGAVCSIVYFAVINDLVNLIGPLIGLVPYIRNLMLMRKSAAYG